MTKAHFKSEENICLIAAIKKVHPEISNLNKDQFQELKKNGLKWNEINEEYKKLVPPTKGYPQRDNQSLSHRFFNYLAPDVKLIKWDANENQRLLELYEAIGSRPSEIAKQMGCSANDVKNHLKSLGKKSQNPIKKPWTNEDDIRLQSLVNQFGRKWTTIRTFFPDRSLSGVKNRYGRIKGKTIMETPIVQVPVTQSQQINSQPANQGEDNDIPDFFQDPFFQNIRNDPNEFNW